MMIKNYSIDTMGCSFFSVHVFVLEISTIFSAFDPMCGLDSMAEKQPYCIVFMILLSAPVLCVSFALRRLMKSVTY